MPGLTIVAGNSRHVAAAPAAVKSVARAGDSVEILFQNDGLAVLWAAHDAYPRRVLESDCGFAILEGTLLAEDSRLCNAALLHFIDVLDKDERRARVLAETWAQNVEGDFVLCVCARHSGAALLLNDPMGRLPVYVDPAHGSVAISREIKTLVALNGAGTLNKATVAQILLFGFPLGGGTLVQNICRLPPAVSVQLQSSNASHTVHAYRTWNFEQLIEPAKPVRKIAVELASVFTSACAAQARISNAAPVVLHLSGGLDSRAVAAGLSRAGVPYVGATFAGSHGYDRDAAFAADVACVLRVPWQLYRPQQPGWEAIEEATLLRDGLNYAGMAARLEYLGGIRRDFGAQTLCFTGDGGDKVFPDLRAPWWVTNLKRYVDYRLEGSLFPLHLVADLLAMDAQQIRSAIVEHFSTYPEKTVRYREAHFLICERAWGWLLEGEERNRTFCWHQTPFYTRRFFESAMRVAPRHKRNQVLHTAFLSELHRDLAALPNARWNAPVGSRRAIRCEFTETLYDQIPSSLRARLRSMRRRIRPRSFPPHRADQTVLDTTLDLLNDEAVREAFKTQHVRELLRTCSDAQFYYLATQLIYVARTWGGRRVESPA